MKDKQITALVNSIEHWKRLANGTSATDEEIFSGDCDCCKKFYRMSENSFCVFCPISEYGFQGCINDEYEKVDYFYENYLHPKKSKRFKAAASKQVELLERVLAWVKADKPTLVFHAFNKKVIKQ